MITLENNYLTIKIKKLGAELCSVIDRKTNYEFIWQADEDYWGRHAPVLFPIVGRLKNDQYEYTGETYEMTQHGFARDSMFAVEELTANSVTFSLEDDRDTWKVYPFKFRLLIKYLLHENNVTVTYEVKNRALEEEMYYSIGGHPAFNVAQRENDQGEEEFERIAFRLEPEKDYKYIPLSEDGLLELTKAKKVKAEKPKVTHETFKKDALIYEIDAQTEMVLEDDENQAAIRLKPSRMDYVGVWSPYPARASFICLEPWAGVADSEKASGQLTEKLGTNKLEPTEKMSHEYSIHFMKKAQL